MRRATAWEAVSALPHVELLAAQAGDADHFTNVQRAARVAGAFLHIHGASVGSRRRVGALMRMPMRHPVRKVSDLEAVTHKYSCGSPSSPARRLPSDAGSVLH
jgi:hypothetical protein